MAFDFAGWATKNDLRCTDGRIIRRDAFKEQDGIKVPLVWQHMHDGPENVLGHAMLFNKPEGVWAEGYFNETPKANLAKSVVAHGDIESLSIYANKLVQKGSEVIHGCIKEVSLVLFGANPGALIDNLAIGHADGQIITDEEAAFIYTGLPIQTSDSIEHAEEEESSSDEKTLKEIFDSMTEEQKNVVYAMVAAAASGEEMEQSDQEEGEVLEHSEEEGENIMHLNAFAAKAAGKQYTPVLSHSEITSIFEDAKKCGSLKQAFMAHAESNDKLKEAYLAHAETNGTPGVDYGIENIEVLFPDYRNVSGMPEVVDRDQEWVQEVIGKATKTPFSRIRSWYFDITADVARARGYKKGYLKKEEVIKAGKRVTNPTTIYKKQKLDRDDIIDISDFDVVAFLKREMQGKLREEVARAILVSDGREEGEDKIDESCIRPIYKEEEAYAYHVEITVPEATPNDVNANDWIAMIDSIALGMLDYDGSGSPTMFTTKKFHTYMTMIRDRLGRKLYDSDTALGQALKVSKIVEVPVMEDMKSDDGKPLYAIIVNMRDYNIGTNRGGEVNFFDDFDIDYNQYKYLYETRMSGALTKFDSAVIIEGRTGAKTLSAPSASTMVKKPETK